MPHPPPPGAASVGLLGPNANGQLLQPGRVTDGTWACWSRRVPETGRWSCCPFAIVDQAAEDIAAVDLSGGWRFRRYALAR